MDAAFSDTIVFESRLTHIGAFRCAREYPGFGDTGPIQHDCFVFPRTEVAIEHESGGPFAANPNVVTFYNRSQRYQRHAISERGDQCEWFGVDRAAALEIAHTFDSQVEDRPFRITRGPCDSQTYLAQRRLFHRVTSGELRDPLEIEETVLFLLACVLRQAKPETEPQPLTKRQRALSHEIECMLSAGFSEPLTLDSIAARCGLSPFRLCRIFRAATGVPIHQYLMRLRVRHGLERVAERPLSRVAVDLGFSHHSHFTMAFRREFGVTPSRTRHRC